MQIQKVTWLQCCQLWWRFALCFLGTLLVCSLATHLLLAAATTLTSTLPALKQAQQGTPTTAFGPIHTWLLHLVGMLSISTFIACQIILFYCLLNYNAAVRRILYAQKCQNPYPAPLSTQQHLSTAAPKPFADYLTAAR